MRHPADYNAHIGFATLRFDFAIQQIIMLILVLLLSGLTSLSSRL